MFLAPIEQYRADHARAVWKAACQEAQLHLDYEYDWIFLTPSGKHLFGRASHVQVMIAG